MKRPWYSLLDLSGRLERLPAESRLAAEKAMRWGQWHASVLALHLTWTLLGAPGYGTALGPQVALLGTAFTAVVLATALPTSRKIHVHRARQLVHQHLTANLRTALFIGVVLTVTFSITDYHPAMLMLTFVGNSVDAMVILTALLRLLRDAPPRERARLELKVPRTTPRFSPR